MSGELCPKFVHREIIAELINSKCEFCCQYIARVAISRVHQNARYICSIYAVHLDCSICSIPFPNLFDLKRPTGFTLLCIIDNVTLNGIL